ncbi:FGGY-family carbohydrate kinase [Clostridium sp. D53t1_180928_C8]|uniref:FGGY-family carbohydrate kinase n=1 Tax=Clostridium sp. D53t1_180928_C8 TaxID=2787101 RepID=UPI0018A92BEA|nr:FGGY-family carbohydrate kinase [Clostridium sp. D53t1_180928_C8]
MNVLVLDIGTSSMRGILFKENGKKLFITQKSYKLINKNGGIVEQEVSVLKDALYYIVGKVVKEAKRISEEIDVISVTGQRSSIIVVDENGQPLCNSIMWQDVRNSEVCDKLLSKNDIIFEKSGCGVNTIFSGSKIRWMREQEKKIYEKTYKVLNIPSYIMYLMTGEYITDYTYGSRTNLMNIKECKWDLELLNIFDVERKYLCDLKEPGSIIGKIKKEFFINTGIKEGTNVISAGGDQQCGAIGQGVYKEGELSIVVGTGAFLVTSCNNVPHNLTNDVICNASSVNGKYIIESNVLTCCSAFNWFCKNFYNNDNIDYELINKELESVYMENGECLVLPYFQGRSTPDWNSKAQAVFSNISLATKRQDILKGILEGVFIEINNNVQRLKKYVDIKHIYVSGGLTKSSLINQMQADVYGVPIYIMEECESTALGALIVTLYNLGIYNTIDEAFETINKNRSVEVYSVNEVKYKEYEKKQKDINELYMKIYA